VTVPQPISREELLNGLENPPGLPLEGILATGIDLSSDAIEIELNAFRAAHGADAVPAWYSHHTRGVNLAGKAMSRARLDDAKAWRADLRDAELADSVFAGAAVSDFSGADLTRADLSAANLSRSDFRRATLAETNFKGTDLRDCDLRDAELTGVHLSDAILGNTRISRNQIEGQIAEERAKDYAAAITAYAAVKVNFRGLGRFADASWAYIQERRMETNASAPWRLSGNVGVITWLVASAKWLGGVLSGWLAGYGERPMRAFLWVPAIILAYTVLYWRVGDISENNKVAGFGACLRHSLQSFVTMSTTTLGPRTAGGEVFTSIEAMTGISLLARVMFSLGKRITRT
jgi:Pentapeptide repeats (8 copies)